MQTFDTFFVIELHALAGSSIILKYLSIFLASYLQYVMAILLSYFVFRSRNFLKRNISIAALAVFAALTARLFIKSIIVLFYPHPRPYVALSQIHSFIPPVLNENYQSFPSGHAIFFFALSWVIYRYDRKWGKVFLLASSAMGVARVAVGVHWPSDIWGGIILGVLTAELCIVVFNRFLFQEKRLDGCFDFFFKIFSIKTGN